MNLSLVDPAACPGCERLRNAISVIEIDVQNTEIALRSERRKSTLLQGQLDNLLDESAAADEVREIFQIWRGTTNHHRAKLLAERKKLIGKMLKHYGRDRCVMAVIGASPEAGGAYTNPKTGVVYNQIAHIFGDEERFERFEAAGRRYCAPQLERKRRTTTVAQTLKSAGMGYVDDDALQVTHFKCPVCRAADEDPLYYPLIVRYDGKHGYCRACFTDLADILEILGRTTLLQVA